jgi:ribosomal-protein-alanine N-acetyltransferase
MNADPVVMEHFPAPLTREQSDALVDRIEAHFDEHGYGLWAVEADGAFVGFTGLVWQTYEAPFTPAPRGRLATRPRRWGHGYATEAAHRSAARRAAGGRQRREHDRPDQRAVAAGHAAARHAARARVRAPAACRRGHPVRPHVLYRAP